MDLLEALGDVERWVSVAWVAGRALAIPDDELNEALRRALVVRAVGGDPQRELELEEEAVMRLADELDTDQRKHELQLALETLGRQVTDRPELREAIVVLIAEPDVAWRAYACSLIAEAI